MKTRFTMMKYGKRFTWHIILLFEFLGICGMYGEQC